MSSSSLLRMDNKFYGSTEMTPVASIQVATQTLHHYEVEALDLCIAADVLIVKSIMPHILGVIQNNYFMDQDPLASLRDLSFTNWDVVKFNRSQIESLLQIINDPENPLLKFEEIGSNEEGKIFVGKSITLLEPV